MYQFQKPCCIDWPQKNKQEKITVTAPTCPTYRRKKIFQHESPLFSELTAAFPVSIEESKVEVYE
jgi:hypothetical protein